MHHALSPSLPYQTDYGWLARVFFLPASPMRLSCLPSLSPFHACTQLNRLDGKALVFILFYSRAHSVSLGMYRSS